MNLTTIVPNTKQEREILDDLFKLKEHGLTLAMLREDLKDDPQGYPYTEDDLAKFIITYELNPEITPHPQPKEPEYPEALAFLGKCPSQISSLIMDLGLRVDLNPIQDLDFKVDHQIAAFITLVDFTMALGNDEHSNDWDPYLQIILYTGDIIDTANGYYEIELNRDDNTITVTLDHTNYSNDDDEQDVRPLTIEVNRIRSIELTR